MTEKRNSTWENLHQTALKAPQSSGVYLWHNELDVVIYIGKAKNQDKASTQKEENKSDDYVKLDKLYQETDELYQALKHWRKEQADQEKLPAFCIFSNAVLDGICAKRPQSLEALGEIKGLGKKKIEKYGEQLLEIVKQNA